MRKSIITLIAVLAFAGVAFAHPDGGTTTGGAVSTQTETRTNPETGKPMIVVVISTGTNPLAAEQAVLQAP